MICLKAQEVKTSWATFKFNLFAFLRDFPLLICIIIMHNRILRNSSLRTNGNPLQHSLCNDDNVVITIDWTSHGHSLVRKGGNPVNGTLVSVCHSMQNVNTGMCFFFFFISLLKSQCYSLLWLDPTRWNANQPNHEIWSPCLTYFFLLSLWAGLQKLVR